MVTIPVWFIVMATLAGMLLSMALLLLAIFVPRKVKQEEVKSVEQVEPAKSIAETTEIIGNPLGAVLLPDKPSGPVSVVAAKAAYKPIPPFRQRYWYTVAGVKGRFATLREAAQAAGCPLGKNANPDWKKLSPENKRRITRTPLSQSAPVPESSTPAPAVVPSKPTSPPSTAGTAKPPVRPPAIESAPPAPATIKFTQRRKKQ